MLQALPTKSMAQVRVPNRGILLQTLGNKETNTKPDWKERILRAYKGYQITPLLHTLHASIH